VRDEPRIYVYREREEVKERESERKAERERAREREREREREKETEKERERKRERLSCSELQTQFREFTINESNQEESPDSRRYKLARLLAI